MIRNIYRLAILIALGCVASSLFAQETPSVWEVLWMESENFSERQDVIDLVLGQDHPEMNGLVYRLARDGESNNHNENEILLARLLAGGYEKDISKGWDFGISNKKSLRPLLFSQTRFNRTALRGILYTFDDLLNDEERLTFYIKATRFYQYTLEKNLGIMPDEMGGELQFWSEGLKGLDVIPPALSDELLTLYRISKADWFTEKVKNVLLAER